MKIASALFISSSPGLKNCPEGNLPEFAFIGRSNVGKSSLINMLTGRKNLAKISGTPGKTRLVNHYLINDQWFLVDLPGYGFAKISREIRTEIDQHVRNYLSKRKQLHHIFLLIDSRLLLQKNDLGFITWMNRFNLPFTVLFTKTDKLSRSQLNIKMKNFREALIKNISIEPQIIITSAKNGTGKEEILDAIEQFGFTFP